MQMVFTIIYRQLIFYTVDLKSSPGNPIPITSDYRSQISSASNIFRRFVIFGLFHTQQHIYNLSLQIFRQHAG